MWIGLKAEKSIYCTLFLRHSLKKTDQQLANHTSEKRLANNWLAIIFHLKAGGVILGRPLP